ncbi:hypothetical protein GALL_464160 [mine drainage metagenome]|uniref:Uncharacterized protein n=1 Tax=mine drainage metagenome TaxID=410659 RepID=A0A1J5Q3C3_9ZZZZ
MAPGQDVLDLGDLLVVPARMDDIADWTVEPTLALQSPMSGPTRANRALRNSGCSCCLIVMSQDFVDGSVSGDRGRSVS